MSIYSKNGSSRTKQSLLKGLLSAAAAVLLAATVAVPTANAAVTTVDTDDPTNTTMSLFDYWITSESDISTVWGTTGINSGHQLQFNLGKGTGINKWSGSSAITSYVYRNLVNGYPMIKGGTYTVNGTTAKVTDESLAYLFNSNDATSTTNSVAGKRTYSGVKGLFQLLNGYYEYNCADNFALLNTSTNTFSVYSLPAVYNANGSSVGQFFPLTKNQTASDVFDTSKGTAKTSVTADSNSVVNHHIGVTMETSFVQPKDGMVSTGEAMSYEFSGDDDVWVYIDDVLVGDLGGIHSKATLDIDFSTGNVTVNSGTATTLKALFEEAAVEALGSDATDDEIAAAKEAVDKKFDGSTFLDNSKHTLKFFYLERGASASNMYLKFNLQSTPQSEVSKVDQNGNAVEGATFELYSADENWNQNYDTPLAKGTTDENGKLTLIRDDADDPYVINFDTLAADDYTRYILKEVSVPAGYRSGLAESNGVMYLQYVAAEGSTSTGGVLVPANNTDSGISRLWTDGTFVGTNETITATSDVKDASGNSVDMSEGVTFSVVVKKSSDGKWYPVTGNSVDGFELTADTGVTGAAEAAKAYSATLYTKNTQGYYTVTLSDMPGDIQKYAFMMPDQSQADYTVVTYHSTASTLEGVTENNTVHVEDSAFTRQFSVSLNIANVQNRLWVQKVNENGEAVNGATFGLYDANGVTVADDGTITLREGATPLAAATTADLTSPYTLSGAAEFASDGATYLLTGKTYYLAETSAPAGYELNTTVSKVIVDSTGVYVDAGNDTDGVDSIASVGSLLPTLGQYATNDVIDNTLYKVLATNQTATLNDSGKLEWGATTGEGVALHYAGGTVQGSGSGSGSVVLQYAADVEGADPVVVASSGINRAKITQNGTPTNGTDLGDLQLNQLFTNFTAVRYTNKTKAAYASAPVTGQKTLYGRYWKDADSFSYTIAGADDATKAAINNGTVKGLVTSATATKPESGQVATFTFATEATEGTEAADGKLGFTKAGTYTFAISEVVPAEGQREADMTYDEHVSTVTYVVAKNADTDELEVTSVTYSNANATTDADKAVTSRAAFTNKKAASVDYSALTGVKLSTTLTGHDMAAEQFDYTVTPDEKAAAKLGLNSEAGAYKVGAATDGVTDYVSLFDGREQGLKFTEADAGTYTFTVAQNKKGGSGYTNDETVRTVSITVSVDEAGIVTVTTSAKKGAEDVPSATTSVTSEDATPTSKTYAVVPFAMSYAASGKLGGEGSVAISASKTLTGRAATAGEFGFTLRDANNNEVASASNVASADGVAGTVSFTEIDYDIDSLTTAVQYGMATKSYAKDAEGKDTNNAVYTMTYTASENTVNGEGASVLPENVTANASSFTITVTVTDNGDGTLTPAVTYPEGTSSLAFTNTYCVAKVTLSGAKEISAAEGLNPPTLASVAGKFTFTLSADEGTPMPESTTTTNGKTGSVAFGEITYLSSDMEGATESEDQTTRSKDFIYTVTESNTGEAVPGITNDSATHQVKVHVVENLITGAMSATATPVVAEGETWGHAGEVFHFTNTYSVTPTDSVPTDPSGDDGKGGISVTKTLTGRALKEGEFGFNLFQHNDETGEDVAVSYGTNAADGTVSLSAVSFSTPGAYSYKLAEVVPDETKGVSYDTTVYNVKATVTDGGNGTLSVDWQIVDETGKALDGEAAKKASFTNTYSASMVEGDAAVVVAKKVLEGAQLTNGQFSFELADSEGNVVRTAKNDAEGNVTFEGFTYTFDQMVDDEGNHVAVKDFNYVASEVNDGQKNITYDESKQGVTVRVTDDGEGTLTAEVVNGEGAGDVDGDGNDGTEAGDITGDPATEGDGDVDGDVASVPTFTNTYKEEEKPVTPDTPDTPAEPEKELPQTGDTNSMTPIIVAAVAGVALIVAAVVLMKRKK